MGNVAVPESLILAMRASPCLRVDLPIEERVQLLLEDYDWFVRDPDFFCGRLQALVELRGASVVKAWQEKARAGQVGEVFRDLLEKHYDPGYTTSIHRNFKQYGQAVALVPAGRSSQAMDAVARELLASRG